jgi:serralysin
MATSISLSGIGNAYYDGLNSGVRWSGQVTYSFPDAPADYVNPYTGSGNAEPTSPGFAQVSAEQMRAVRHMLDGTGAVGNGSNYGNVEAITNLDFAELVVGSGGADMMIAQSPDANPTAYAYYPSNQAAGGDVWFGTTSNYRTPQLGDYSYLTHIHELGHALGLKHAHETGGPANVAVPNDRNSLEFTVMTYRSFVNGANGPYSNETFGYPTTFMMLDIVQLQYAYGIDYGYNSGNSTYTWSPTTGEMFINGVGQGAPGGGGGGSANRIFLTIWDGNGIDTYDLSNYSSNLVIDLNPGGHSVFSTSQLANLGNGNFSRGNVFNALQWGTDARSLIENATGGVGNDRITGNVANNLLRGGDGSDTIRGSFGNDLIYGNQGADLIYGNQDLDVLFGGQANDTLFGGQQADVIYGNFHNDVIYGNFANDLLYGGQGDDTIYGGQNEDTIFGNLGNDVLRGNLGADRFVFGNNSGIDRIMDFNFNSGDRLSILGQSYTTQDTAEGFVINLSGGGSVILVGLHQTDFSTAFFV